MKKGSISKIFKTILSMACMLVVICFFAACSFGETESSYSVTGYVFDEYGAVEGVEIKNELGSVFTDSEGKYTISGIKASIIVEPVCDGYKFAEVSKMITNENDDANFSASKEYTVKGHVKNNTSNVYGAYVTIESLAGTFKTITNEDGYFEGQNVAGEATISCELDGVKFFSQTATIDNNIVNINLTSTFSLGFTFDTDDVDLSAINLLVGGKTFDVKENNLVFEDVYAGTQVELSSNKYLFSKPTFYIESLNQIETISVSKIYSVSGTVSSGETLIENAEVFVDGVLTTTTDQNGFYQISNLVSMHTISVNGNSLNFHSQTISNKTLIADFVGTKNIVVSFAFDHKVSSTINFENHTPETSDGERFSVFDVQLGEVLSFNSDGYYFENKSVTVGEKDLYEISALAFYSIDASVEDNSIINEDELEILLDGNLVNSTELEKVYGTHVVSARYQNFVFDSKTVSAKQSAAKLTYQIPYNASISVCSGERKIVGAKIVIDEHEYASDDFGVIEIAELVGENKFLILADGFNSKEISVSDSEAIFGVVEKQVSLTYNISGKVKTGTEPVANATVLVKFGESSKSVSTNSVGEFFIDEIEDDAIVEVSKQYFAFVQKTANSNSDLEFDGTYKIFGSLTSSEEGNGNPVKVVLMMKNGDSVITKEYETVDKDGYFEFDEIRGKCSLSTVKSATGEPSGLRPAVYNLISIGGEYNFNNNGFSISGKITSGGIAVAGVYVQAGSNGTFTNEKGEYKFELLTGMCEIIPLKEGYDFGEKVVVSDEVAGGVNFEATYTISGQVLSGDAKIAGVNVLFNSKIVAVSDENGNFAVSKLSGNSVLTFEKNGYRFENSVNVNAACSVSVSCKVIATVSVKTGDIDVFDFSCMANGVSSTAVGRTLEVVAISGETISLSKKGYIIEDVTVFEPKLYVASASYSVSGKVCSGNVEISNVAIKGNGMVVYTDSNGNFELSEIVGSMTYSFEKTGYSISSFTASEASDEVLVNASYKVSGKVVLDGVPVVGVKVSYNEKTFITDENGNFVFDEIVGRYSLTFDKQGYTFSEVSNAFGFAEITVNAFYKISGKVVSGDVPVAGASIEVIVSSSPKRVYAISDENGNFEVVGLSGTVTVNVSADGYNPVTKTGISDSVSDLEIQMTYTYTIIFEGVGKTNITIYLNDEPIYGISNKFSRNDFSGKIQIRFERKNTKFTPPSIVVSKPGSRTVNASVSYSVHGKVVAESGDAIKNIKVVMGGETEYTNENGEYKFVNIAGDLVQVSNDYLGTYKKQITEDCEYNITVKNNEFAYLLYAESMEKLKNASSVQVVGMGPVKGVADIGITKVKTTQNAYSLFKRDSAGNIVRQNLNHGDIVSGVDPRVSMVAVYTKSNNQLIHQILWEGNVTGQTSANHTLAGLKGISFEDFKGAYGADYDSMFPYRIDQKSSSISSFAKDGNGNYTFVLSPSLTQTAYAQQIVTLGKVEDFKGFSRINLTFTINKNGWIKKVFAYDEYKIKRIMDNIAITSEITYTFYANDVDTIDISSENAFQASIKQSTKASVYSTNSLKHFDVVETLVYGRKQEESKWKNLVWKNWF